MAKGGSRSTNVCARAGRGVVEGVRRGEGGLSGNGGENGWVVHRGESNGDESGRMDA